MEVSTPHLNASTSSARVTFLAFLLFFFTHPSSLFLLSRCLNPFFPLLFVCTVYPRFCGPSSSSFSSSIHLSCISFFFFYLIPFLFFCCLSPYPPSLSILWFYIFLDFLFLPFRIYFLYLFPHIVLSQVSLNSSLTLVCSTSRSCALLFLPFLYHVSLWLLI